jgi:hypothetical protein
MVQVTDSPGTAAIQPLPVHVDGYIAPVDILTPAVAAAAATVPYAQGFDAVGGHGTYRWTLADGHLPAGLTLSPAGVLSGSTAEQGTATFTVTAVDAIDDSRRGSRTFLLTVGPPPNQPPTVSVVAPVNGAVMPVGSIITLAAQAGDIDGAVQRVDFYAAGIFVGSGVAPGFTAQWQVPTAGAYTFSAVAVDDDNATTASSQVSITTTSEVLIYATQVVRMVGNYQLSPDATAAAGYGLWNPNRSVAKVTTAAPAPAAFAEFTFVAEAGRPYHLWIRGRGERNDYENDSAFVQFDGVASARIGTTSSLTVNIEEGPTAGLNRFGWQDNGYGIGVLGTDVIFERTGMQTIRIQPREDGLLIDQIVLSPEKYLTVAPGAAKGDTTILPR